VKLRDFIIKRIILLIPVLIGVTLITFYISHIIPADVARVFAGGEKANPETIARIRMELHLDEQIYKQYYYYIIDLLHGNFGRSYMEHRPVLDAIRQYFPATAELTIVAMAFAMPTGILLGIISAVRRNKLVDHITRLIAITGVSIPIFWLALMTQIIFAYKFPILPLDSRIGVGVIAPTHITGLFVFDSLITGNFVAFKSSLFHLILPAFTLGFASLGTILRITRSSMLEIIRADYIRTARAKGLKERTVIYRHALRNALIPTVTISAIAFAALLGGAVLTETIFNWPGMGRFAVAAVNSLDFSSVMGFTIIMAIIMVFTNMLVDIIYTILDPRVRLGD